MSETNESITLTLDPTGAAAATAAAVRAEAATAAVSMPTEEKAYGVIDESILSEEEKKTVDAFAAKIDVTDSAQVMQYGAAAQQKVAAFSDAALQNVRTKDFGELGDMMANLVVELKEIEAPEKEKGFLGFFKRASRSVKTLKAKYDKAEVNVDKIVDALEDHQVVLLKDIATLDKMYDMNLAYLKELTMYIIAGKKRLAEARETTLVALVEKAKASGLPEDTQAANDFREKCERFEKKLYDLELTRTIAIQMAPQIRLVQNNDTLMTEKIQSTIVNTIPLWKSQMVIALGMAHSSEAMKAERAVTDMTNELLKKNAEALHQSTVDIAKESERGIVDIETLMKTNEQLIQTLDEVQQIQAEGHAKRAEAEKELARMEGQLRDKLLSINDKK